MRNWQKALSVLGCVGFIVGASGCANNENVIREEPVAGNELIVGSNVVKSKNDSVATNQEGETNKAASNRPEVVGRQPVKEAESQPAIERIYFSFDSSDLSKEARDTLVRNEQILANMQKNVRLRIEGNCDQRGSAEYNLALGERRAKAAANYLINMGVNPEMLSTISYGKERPAVQGNDENSWSKNRRDEFVVVK
ncbi:MAG: peptidoglycan-associated lipoprotein Pal [Geobacteraceae bacterium]|nr:peptidoglycan-associated lipoprotein Pal [Geobacteraceae bacterium]